MINVEKKELSERTFVPYELKITVSSQEEHNKLKTDFMNLKNLSAARWYELQRKSPAIDYIVNAIIEHL